MIQNVLSKMIEAGQLQAIVFILFFVFFIIVVLVAMRIKKPVINHLSSLPLDETKIK